MTDDRARRQLVLFLDWDETVTAHDTLSLIAPPDDDHPGVRFAEYGKAYMDDLKRHEEEWRPSSSSSSSSSQAASPSAISIPRPWLEDDEGQAWREEYAFLGSLDAVELASQRRIETGGLFVGCDGAALERRGIDGVRLRDGWPLFAQQHLERSDGDGGAGAALDCHIISVGWSARFIAARLRAAGTPISSSICANEVEIDASTQRGTGRLTKSRDAQPNDAEQQQVGRGGIRTAHHKVREMRRIVQTKDRANSTLTVYVGDSSTDLPCMVEADVGLLIGGKQSLRQSIEQIGFQKYLLANALQAIPHVQERIRAGRSSFEGGPCLVVVQDWIEASKIVTAIRQALVS